MKTSAKMAVAAVSLGVSQLASGQSVQWRVSDGGNGHWYEARPVANWFFAVKEAAARGGSLACISNDAENSFVRLVLVATPAGRGYLGLEQLPNQASPTTGWGWASGEPYVFQNWTNFNGKLGFVAPDDTPCNTPPILVEDGQADVGMIERDGRWDDMERDQLPCNTPWSHAAIIEWSADCNNDGIVDYGQCRDGSLPDYNGNNIPDCCEQGTPCTVGNYPVQWRIENGGSGHWYAAVPSGPLPWDAARAASMALGGDLVTITSVGESDHVWPIVDQPKHWAFPGMPMGPWIGAFQGPDGPEPTGDWRWVSGESFVFEEWSEDNPNNNCAGGAEGYAHYWGTCCFGRGRNWNDFPIAGCYGSQPRSFVVEWSADCNADGIVDYGQILTGQFADANANGVPDICEAYEVPAEFSTIQSAIDAVPAGEYGLVAVAAGVYNESFSLNGKNVLVRGAAGGATILDGAGLSTSIARFTGGEPATAGLESLVFRNATSGSVPHKGAAYRVGGAVYGFGSSARIRDCRFEDNRSDFGGAMYLILSTLDVSGCEFVSNEGVAEGGGVLVYQCTGVVSGCEFLGNSCGLAGPGSGSGFKAVGALGVGEEVVLSGCTFTGNTANLSGSAVEFYENLESTSGRIRLVDTVIAGNASGLGTPSGAAGLRVIGTLGCATIGADVEICGNSPRNISGPYLVAGAFVSCDCEADITGDGLVNGADLGVLLGSWGLANAQGTGDLNHDGLVTGADLTLVLGSWGGCQ